MLLAASDDQSNYAARRFSNAGLNGAPGLAGRDCDVPIPGTVSLALDCIHSFVYGHDFDCIER